MPILPTINGPGDLKKLPESALAGLAQEIRSLIIETCAVNGGHLAPSLGVVELTIALHRVFNSPLDKLIWDVGHQAYAHKILTGRRDSFHTLRTLNGISGFPKRHESEHDVWEVGHSSTSLSAATGFAVSRDLKQDSHKVVAVIGDGSMTGGLAFEALNNAGHLNRDLIVILNDNEMSIAENVGALSGFLSRTSSSEFIHRLKRQTEDFIKGIGSDVGQSALKVARKIEKSFKGLFTPAMMFQTFGFEYVGPIDGHDLPLLMETMERVRKLDGAVLVHVLTTKGKGYKPAEQNPALFHGVGPFDIETGKVLKGKGGQPPTPPSSAPPLPVWPRMMNGSLPSPQPCRTAPASPRSQNSSRSVSLTSVSLNSMESPLPPALQQKAKGRFSPSTPAFCNGPTTRCCMTSACRTCRWCSPWTAAASSAVMVPPIMVFLTSPTCAISPI